MTDQNETFWGKQTYIGIPLRVQNQTHLSSDGEYYDCRPEPNAEVTLPTTDTPIKEAGLVLNILDALLKQADVGLDCFACALLRKQADGTFTCGHSGQQLVSVEGE